MPVELLKDPLKTDIIIAQDTTQAIIEGDILVPDIKPDISRVISVDGGILISKTEVAEKKVLVDGTIKFKILYVSEKGDAVLYSIDSSTSFKQTINIEGISNQGTTKVAANIEHIDYTINNERKIGIKAVINLITTNSTRAEKEATKDIVGIEDIQVLRESHKYTEILGEAQSETLVKDTFELKEDLPPIKEILSWKATSAERETKITDGKVIVGGMINIELLYIADDYDSTINLMKQQLPFTHFVEVAGATSDMKYKLMLDVPEVYTDIKENIQGELKILEIEAIAKVEVRVVRTLHQDLVTDAYSPTKKLKIIKDEITLKENIGMNRSHVMLRETLDAPANSPEISRILSVNARPILSDYSLTQDKVILEGIMDTTVIYANEADGISIHSFIQEIPFRHFIDVEGLKEGMEADVDLYTDEISFEVINSQQLDIKVNVGATCEGYLIKTKQIVNEIIELEDEGNPLFNKPSITIYYIQPGDTLWKVAKKYGTTVKQLLASNNIDEATTIKVGDYLLIEKVHKFKL